MTSMAITRMSTCIELDTDSISPDSLKASFEVAVDNLRQRADRAHLGLDWSTLQFGMQHSEDGESRLVLRAGVLQ